MNSIFCSFWSHLLLVEYWEVGINIEWRQLILTLIDLMKI